VKQEQVGYETARFLGILIRNPKLLGRLADVLPFSWEKGKKVIKQTVGQMKAALHAIAGVQGISKKPLKKMINERAKIAKRRERYKKQKAEAEKQKAVKPKEKKDGSNSSV
jgi:hypothetical protein